MTSTDSSIPSGLQQALPESSSSNSHHGSTETQRQSRNADVMPTFGNNGAGRIGRYQIIKTLGEGSFGKVKCKYLQI